MWPFSTPQTPEQHPEAPPSACPVDHTTREAWLAQNPASSSKHPHPAPPAPAANRLSTDREISSIPRWRNASTSPDTDAFASQSSTAEEKWVYPSPSSFFNALVRKERDPNPVDMPVVVPIHNAVNERVWEQVLEWERAAGAPEGGSKLVSFVGRPKDYSPRARWKTLIGYSPPFDRHDWIVDRAVPSSTESDSPASIRLRYVIDFYTGRLPLYAARPEAGDKSAGGAEQSLRPNLSFFIDCRPALDGWDGVEMRVKRFWNGVFGQSQAKTPERAQ